MIPFNAKNFNKFSNYNLKISLGLSLFKPGMYYYNILDTKNNNYLFHPDKYTDTFNSAIKFVLLELIKQLRIKREKNEI